MTTERHTRSGRRRRPRPAAGGRILVAGLSASTALVLVAAMGAAERDGAAGDGTPPDPATVAPSTVPTTAGVPPPAAPTPGVSRSPNEVPPPPPVAPTRSAPVTRSRAS